ncbi:head maturation protease, ClpP-related [Peterkaempfera sp. SMS 1(5)a]|uniref:head maturation protease, ClpP-related n=1 Tax=Peterkaempfera podocarpi TaxID=3232308 RepID=UPI00366DAF1F
MDWITNLRERAPGMRPQAPTAAARPWYSIRNGTGAETAEVLLYDEIGGWWGTLAEDLVAELRAITAPNITVRINSPGGSVFDGISIANALRAHPAAVTVQVDGLAASIASVIALAGDRLVMAPNSMLMIHDASGGCLGNAADMQQMADLLDKISDNIASAYASKAGGTSADWRQMMLAETWYNADEAVAAGLADEVTPSRAADGDDEPEMRNAWDLSVFRYAGREQAPAPANLTARPAQRVPALTLAAAIATTPPPATAAASVLVDADAQRIGEAVLSALCGAAPETAPPAPGEGPALEEQPTDTTPETAVTDPSPDPVDTPSDAPVAAAPSSDDDPSTPVTDQAAPDGAADGWAAMVAHLTAPSPGADDVFAALKEALL